MFVSPGSQDRVSVATPDGSTLWLNLVTLFCIAFGISLILNVQVAGDGMWFWYGKLLLAGKHIYGDLHLPLQPLYVLLTAGILRVFGDGWLVSKLPALGMVLFLVLAMRAIARKLPLRDGPRSMVLLGAFALPLLFEADRFDDYHTFADCFQVASILILFRLRFLTSGRKVYVSAILLGLCSGFSMMSRLNDGALLWCSVLICILGLAPLRRFAAAAIFSVSAAVAVCATVLATRDTFRDWIINSILRAAGPKGGSGHLIFYPFQLVWHAFAQFFHYPVGFVLLFAGVMVSLAVLLLARLPQLRRPQANVHLPAAVFVVAGFAYIVLVKVHWWGITGPPLVLCATVDLVCTVLGVVTLLRAAGALTAGSVRIPAILQQFHPVQLLVLVPLSQLFSGSLSSGGDFVPLTAPVGMLLLVLPYAFPSFFRWDGRAYAYASVVGICGCCCIAYKSAVPFSWHSYRNAALFTNREWYRHPQYGPMYIETDLLNFITPICERAHDVSDPTLFSSPFPYANYFCNVAPWRGEVQTFFDISTEPTIRDVDAHLITDPPHTIVYQRQIANMVMHERIYQHHNRLPHRELDTLLMQQLQRGDWTLAQQQCLGDSDWLVIETVPRASQPAGRALSLNAFPYRCNNILPSQTRVIHAIEDQ